MCGSWRKVPSNKYVSGALYAISITVDLYQPANMQITYSQQLHFQMCMVEPLTFSCLDKTVNKYFKFLAVVCALVLTASVTSYAKGGGGGGGSGGGAGSGSAGAPTGAGTGTGVPVKDGTGIGAPTGAGTGTGVPVKDGTGIGAPVGAGTGTGVPVKDGTGIGAPAGAGTGATQPGTSKGR